MNDGRYFNQLTDIAQAATNTSPSFHRIDQLENHRRELEAARIAALPDDEQQAAVTAEAVIQEAYTVLRRDMIQFNTSDTTIFTPQHIPNLMTGLFLCSYPGCTALPFQTQYLLKYVCPPMLATWPNYHSSHTNVHSATRPHYCPDQFFSPNAFEHEINPVIHRPQLKSTQPIQTIKPDQMMLGNFSPVTIIAQDIDTTSSAPSTPLVSP